MPSQHPLLKACTIRAGCSERTSNRRLLLVDGGAGIGTPASGGSTLDGGTTDSVSLTIVANCGHSSQYCSENARSSRCLKLLIRSLFRTHLEHSSLVQSSRHAQACKTIGIVIETYRIHAAPYIRARDTVLQCIAELSIQWVWLQDCNRFTPSKGIPRLVTCMACLFVMRVSWFALGRVAWPWALACRLSFRFMSPLPRTRPRARNMICNTLRLNSFDDGVVLRHSVSPSQACLCHTVLL